MDTFTRGHPSARVAREMRAEISTEDEEAANKRLLLVYTRDTSW